MRLKLMILFCCVIQTLYVTAQQVEKTYPLYVIAPNGLKLREGPGTQYKVLHTAPYKSKVLLTDAHFMQNDSTQKIKLPYTYYAYDDYVLTGAWLKIRYKNTEGYMLSTWLYHTCEFSDRDSSSDLNKDVKMFYGINDFECITLPNTSSGYYYALIKDSNGQQTMEKTSVEFLAEVGDMGYGLTFSLIARRTDHKKFNALIYSKAPMAEGSIKQLPVPSFDSIEKKVHEEILNYNGNHAIYRKLLLIAKNEQLKKVHLQMTYDSSKNETKIFSTTKGKQKLMYIEKQYEGYGLSNVSLVADLDGDGILDYILGFGDEKSSIDILFLSSRAEPGQTHKAVASIRGGYTC